MTTTDTGHTRVAEAGKQLRAYQACRQLETEFGIHGATPAYNAAEGGYTGDITIDPDELLAALADAYEDLD